MSDDLDRRLDDLYRGARRASAPLRERWKSEPRRARPLVWASVAAAAALVTLLPVLFRKAPAPPGPVPVVLQPPTPLAPPPLPPPPPPAPKPLPPPLPAPAPLPVPVLPAPVPEPLPEPAPPLPAPEPAPAPHPETPKKTTLVERAVATLMEVEGSFELAGRALKGTLKDVAVLDGDRLVAQGVVRLTLAPDRYVLLAPRTQALFRPSKERLALHLEQGELVAELTGPGPALAVLTRTCEIRHLGTVFSVKLEEKRTLVLVEEGRVQVLSPKGETEARAGQGVLAAEGVAPATLTPPELRLPAWARSHRPPERALWVEDFNVQGTWRGQIENGAAKSFQVPGSPGSWLRTDAEGILFEATPRGRLSIVYRTDRAGRLKLQTWSFDHKVNFKYETHLLKTQGWRTLALDVADFVCVDPTKALHPPPGTRFAYFLFHFDEDGDRGTLWVDSIRVNSIR